LNPILFIAGEINRTTNAGRKDIRNANAPLLNNPFSVALDTQLTAYVAEAFNS
jgi:hypothetical protein